MAVDQLKQFHKTNLHSPTIKKHYTYFARFTHGRAVRLAQRYGAKVHFNEVKMPLDEFTSALQIDSSQINAEELGLKDGLVNFRYGICDTNDMVRDMAHWETLFVSSMLQRPTNNLIEVPSIDSADYDGYKELDFHKLQQANLKSALAFSALTTRSGMPETELYENIVQIPHYESKWLQLIDREDEIALVKDNLDDFRALYKPLIEDDFGELMRITSDGRFELTNDSMDARIALMSHVNDNVLQNLDGTFLEGMKRYKHDEKENIGAVE